MILILTHREDDPTVLCLGQHLRALGGEPVVIGPATLESPSSLVIANDPAGGAKRILRLGERTIDLSEVRAAWLWRSWHPHQQVDRFRAMAMTADAKQHAWSFYEQQWLAFHHGFSLLLAQAGVFCVNPPPWNLAFEEKCCQLALAAEVGLAVPPTLFTTRLTPAKAFHDELGGALVYKPFKAYLRRIDGRDGKPARVEQLFTNTVAVEDLVEGPGFLPTPGIFQPYVEKDVELRIVVVGRRLFACAIHSQRSDRSREDWRRYDLERTPYLPYDLPEDVAAKLLALMDRLGLVFGSIDMIVTPDGEHVFLEVNPNGQFDWVARRAGLPIYEALAALLLAGRVRERSEEPAAVGAVTNQGTSNVV
jgi:glutathione synthase/RimK-type ligase-like ATP-grasp enzyme